MAKKKLISELRQDIVSGEWIAIAPGRVKRFGKKIPKRLHLKPQPKSKCPFEDLQKTGHGLPILALNARGKEFVWESGKKNPWFLQVLPNKFPIVGAGDCSVAHRAGPYAWLEGAGFHEIVIYRDHDRQPAYWSKNEISVMLEGYRRRHKALGEYGCVKYVLIYHNHGPQAGATIYHPHSQIVALPVIPPDVGRSIQGSAAYYKRHKRCAHCDMISWEKKTRTRILYENKEIIAFCPYTPRVSYEVRLFPKKHESVFEQIDDVQREDLADALQKVLRKIAKGLGEPSYNFFIHTAPTKPEAFKHYHWHIEVLPRTSVWAGVELGTGIEVSSITPEDAARYLRKF